MQDQSNRREHVENYRFHIPGAPFRCIACAHKTLWMRMLRIKDPECRQEEEEIGMIIIRICYSVERERERESVHNIMV